MRQAAAQALGQLEVKEERMIQVLVKRLEDRKERVCRAAAKALGALGALGVREERVFQVLFEMLEDEEEAVRCEAAVVLNRLKGERRCLTNL